MSESLKQKYRDVLVGFEKFSFTEGQILNSLGEFDAALKDLQACKECDGGEICRTTINYKCAHPYWHTEGQGKCRDECYPGKQRMYYALYKLACEKYQMPMFAFFYCPGVAQRKEQILNAMVAKAGLA